MAEDDEVILKGSALYQHLLDNGFENFESYERITKDAKVLQAYERPTGISVNSELTPKWAMDHLTCLLTCGLILDDHRHFIEYYLPLEVQLDSTSKSYTSALYAAPFLCAAACFIGYSKTSSAPQFLFGAAGIGCLSAMLFTKKILQIRSHETAIKNLCITLAGLERTFIQFKRMLLLVYQNDLMPLSISLHYRESFQLKKKLQISLVNAIKKLFQCLDDVKKIPLAIDVNPALESLSVEEVLSILREEECGSITHECLKKLFNSYILIQSEFLRRYALCFCSEIWSPLTVDALLTYSLKHLIDIRDWSSQVSLNLIQEQKVFRAIMESKDKQSQLRPPVSSSWDYADVYVSVRSASVHFQSLLLRINYLQEVLENESSLSKSDKKQFLNSVIQILNEISKEINSGKSCIDESCIQAFKMFNCQESRGELSQPEAPSSSEEDLDRCNDSSWSPPIVDEVFELTIPQEEKICNAEEDDWGDSSVEDKLRRKKEGETSKRVLQELKSVLVKKAREWREREKRAMEMKGIKYFPAEQVQSLIDEQVKFEANDLSKCDSDTDLPHTDCQDNWPLPRLKGSLKNHRFRKGLNKDIRSSSKLPSRPPLQPSDIRRAREQSSVAEDGGSQRLGFGSSLLAEAMLKSKAMQAVKKEDVFLCSDDETSSGE